VPLVPSKKSTDPDKQVQEIEEALAEVMAERRENPLYGPLDPKASHALASVRLVHRRVSLRPFQGRRKVLILGDLDRLVVQEASQEAANALLKVLEEPPPDTVIVGTTGSPQALLPTIRSRLVPVRMGVVDDAEVALFLKDVVGLTGRAVDDAVELIQGCPGRAVEGEGGDRAAIKRADDLLWAVKRGSVEWAQRALAQNPWDARGGYTELLDTVAVRLRKSLERAAQVGDGQDVDRLLKAMGVVEQHRTIAQGNVNPQLSMAVMAGTLERLR
jgi:DNA polymerase-3 subunit delta'